MPKYAVAKGKTCGIFDSWDECKEQITGFKGAKYKKFNTVYEAEKYLKESSSTISTTNSLHSVQTIDLDPVTVGLKLNSVNALPVPKISPSNSSLNDISKRITILESKFTLFADNINLKFENILKRISSLENRLPLLASSSNGSSLATSSNEIGENSNVDPQNTEPTQRKKRKIETDDNNAQDTSETQVGNGGKTKLPKCSIVDETDGYSEGWMRHYYPDDSGFLSTPEGAIRVYTDGACTNNGKRGAKAGIGVWFNHDHPSNLFAPVRGRPTNNNAEIQAANAAIIQASKAGIRRLHIFTDSQFLISCITSWIYKWKRNNWVLNDGGPVKNKDELVELDTSIQTLMDFVAWTHVRGHRGDVGNTQADLLARKGATLYKATWK